MLRTVILFFSLFLMMGCTESKIIDAVTKETPITKVSDHVSKLPIALRDNGYGNFVTKLFTKQEELSAFLSQVEYQTGWNQKENFLNTVRIKPIDFETHNLLIYRLTEQSGAIVLAVDVPTEKEKHIYVNLGKEKPEVMTMDMAYYALAYVIDKRVIDITFNDGENNTTIKNSALE